MTVTGEFQGRVLGRDVPRLEDGRLIRGKGCFVDDIALPSMLHAAFVRSSHAHAAIRAIDDIHAPASYRQQLATVLSRRALLKAHERIVTGGGS